MSNAGYIYVLVNPSMDGLVKIGKTTRDPAGRAKELSGATGVPTPFVLAYDAFFDDCSAAEGFVHTLLAQRGYRVSSNREFFNVSLSEATKAVIEAERVLGSASPAGLPLDSPPTTQTTLGEMAWEETLGRAIDSYLGAGLTIMDYAEASRLFKLAAKLGSSSACLMLRTMSKNGEGCNEDSTAALEFFKQAQRIGDDRGWAEMAKLFWQIGNTENTNKCWHLYFGSQGFREDRPFRENKRADLLGTVCLESRISYVVDCWLQGAEAILRGDEQADTFPGSFREELSIVKEELLSEVSQLQNPYRQGDDKHGMLAFYEGLLEQLATQI